MQFPAPIALAIDSGTLLHVADATLQTIQTVNLVTLKAHTLAGQPCQTDLLDGTGSAARFSRIQGITTHSGNLYIADTGNSAIRKLDKSTGLVSTLAVIPDTTINNPNGNTAPSTDENGESGGGGAFSIFSIFAGITLTTLNALISRARH
jgi:hypothetical protein